LLVFLFCLFGETFWMCTLQCVQVYTFEISHFECVQYENNRLIHVKTVQKKVFLHTFGLYYFFFWTNCTHWDFTHLTFTLFCTHSEFTHFIFTLFCTHSEFTHLIFTLFCTHSEWVRPKVYTLETHHFVHIRKKLAHIGFFVHIASWQSVHIALLVPPTNAQCYIAVLKGVRCAETAKEETEQRRAY